MKNPDVTILIEYDGEYPSLCNGKLKAIIIETENGVNKRREYLFPDYALVSGGSVSFDDDYNETITKDEWHIMSWPKGMPDKYKNRVWEEVNKRVPWGCCGGCV